jgi:hypothetical protein
MRLTSIVLATLLAAGSTVGCAVHTYGPVVGRPPPGRMFAREHRPGFVWIPGRWVWQDRWIWEEGYWVPERPGWIYAPGIWLEVGGHYQWRPGRWDRAAPGSVRDHRNGVPPPQGDVRDHRR